MSEWFHAGQKVVCVNVDWPGVNGTQCPLQLGAHYTVKGIGPASGIDFMGRLAIGTALDLVEVSNPDDCYNRDVAPGFDSRRFRPLRKRSTDISIFKAMLSPKKQEVEA